MKTFNRITFFTASLLLAFTTQAVFAGNSTRTRKNPKQDVISISGKVIDATSKAPLVFASVAVKETNVGIITNIDGEFTLKIDAADANKNLEISFLGYKNKVVPISDFKENGKKNVISLDPAPIPIREIIVKPVNPYSVVEKAINNIPKNYENVPNLMTAFYRETIKKNRSYVSLGEAVLEIFKAPYNSDVRFDNTRIYKGRSGTDVQRMDTLLFKLQGGPVTALQLDIVKNTENLLTLDAMKNYNYSLGGVIEINNKPNYIIDFVQKPFVDMPLFMGSLYIEMDSYAITQAEFSINLSDKEKAAALFIRKKPLGVKVIPEVATYKTIYREQNGKWYFSYSRAEVKFKVDWKKKLFNTYYTTMSELAVTDRTDKEVIKFAGKDRLKYNDVFVDEVSAFKDPEFWGNYNVIEPDQSIESAIRRLSRKLKFSDRKQEDQ